MSAVLAPIARYFKFDERSTNIITETRAGVTTFMVMAYIIFLNGSILLGGIGAAKLPIGPNDAPTRRLVVRLQRVKNTLSINQSNPAC